MTAPSQDLPEVALRGTYARKQLLCRDRIIAWAHRSRFAAGRRFIAQHAKGRLLDYGCGDGTFLAGVRDLFPGAVGADIDPALVADCAARLGGLGLAFRLVRELDAEHEARYDIVTCMEVLEHCTEDDVERVLGDLERLASPRGHVILSVPIEIGPALLVKQAVRRLAAWRRLGDYAHMESYSLRELSRMVFACSGTTIERPCFEGCQLDGTPYRYHGHKGFNWRRLRELVSHKFDLRETHFTPAGWTGGFASSQVWFLCRPSVPGA